MALPAAALAQATNQSETATPPASNSIGPQELQNFNLQGTVTRPADAPAARPPATPAARPGQAPAAGPPQADRATGQATSTQRVERPAAAARNAPVAVAPRADSPGRAASSPSLTAVLPPLADGTAGASATQSGPGFTAGNEPAAPLTPERKLPLVPWLLAAIALGAGGGFLFWRNRSAHAYAGGPELDSYVAPTPAPAPVPPSARAPGSVPAPPQPEPGPPPITGIVSTRLRPWIEIGFQPLQCIIENDKVTLHFEIELFNSGSAPARAVLAEASLFNASANQDQVLGDFFTKPAGVGERIVAIEPLKRVVVRSELVVPRSQVQEYELASRKVFVPIIAFNALYRWSRGEGQTSVAYLLGGEAQGDKLAPFRLDLGPRAIASIAARPLPAGLRN